MTTIGGRRELALACLLVAFGGLIMFFAAGRAWASARITAPPSPPRTLTVSGTDLNGGARALSLAALASVAALIALSGRWRAVGGTLLAVTGIGAAVAFTSASPDRVAASAPLETSREAGARISVTSRTGWPYAYLAGGLAVAVAGGLTVLRGHRWPTLGARYDAPAARPEATTDPWTALDRGEDPTAR